MERRVCALKRGGVERTTLMERVGRFKVRRAREMRTRSLSILKPERERYLSIRDSPCAARPLENARPSGGCLSLS